MAFERLIKSFSSSSIAGSSISCFVQTINVLEKFNDVSFFYRILERFVVKRSLNVSSSLSLLVPSQAPAYLALFNISSTALRAVWGQVPECCRHGIIRGYRLFLRDNNTGKFVRNETTEAGQYEFEFSLLLKFYGYSVSVLAFTIKGDGPFIETSAMTDEDGKKGQTNLNTRYAKVTSIIGPNHINNRHYLRFLDS